MLHIAQEQKWPESRFDALFAEASKAHPYYLEYYFVKGSYYSTAWRAAPGKQEAFVEETVRATAPKMGQTMYARLHWSDSELNMFVDGKTDWKRMKAGFEEILAAYPDAWNRNNYAMFACVAQDYETAKTQINLIPKGRFSLRAWERLGEDTWLYDKCRVRAGLKSEATPFIPFPNVLPQRRLRS
jgi:hypothetical protein